MYAGRIVERGTVRAIFKAPRHPYTKGLLESMPRRPAPGEPRKRRLATIEGVVPDLHDLPPGCVFQDRCSLVEPRCREKEPELIVVDEATGQTSRCFRHAEVS